MRALFLASDWVIDPLGIMWLSAVLKERGHTVGLVRVRRPGGDGATSERRRGAFAVDDDLIDEVRRFRPDVLLHSVTTGAHRHALHVNREIRRRVDAVSLFGGPHATFFPEMIDEDGVDAICVGEGFEALPEFLERLEDGRAADACENIHMKVGGRVVRNPVRPLLADLDALPFPDRDLVYADPEARDNRVRNFLSTLGCPFNCRYCFNHAYWALYRDRGRRVRTRSVDSLLREVREVASRYPTSLVYFQDDFFAMARSWREEFCERYPREIGLPFHCHCRPGSVTARYVRSLRDAGCRSVSIAFESGNERLRRTRLGRPMSDDELLATAGLLHRYKLPFRCQNIMGLPGETMRDALDTIRLNALAVPALGWCSLYQPYPRTELGDECIQGRDTATVLASIPASFDETYQRDRRSRRLARLRSLFGICVEYPSLLPAARLAAWLPLDGLYAWIARRWKNRCTRARLFGGDPRPLRRGARIPRFLRLRLRLRALRERWCGRGRTGRIDMHVEGDPEPDFYARLILLPEDAEVVVHATLGFDVARFCHGITRPLKLVATWDPGRTRLEPYIQRLVRLRQDGRVHVEARAVLTSQHAARVLHARRRLAEAGFPLRLELPTADDRTSGRRRRRPRRALARPTRPLPTAAAFDRPVRPTPAPDRSPVSQGGSGDTKPRRETCETDVVLAEV